MTLNTLIAEVRRFGSSSGANRIRAGRGHDTPESKNDSQDCAALTITSEAIRNPKPFTATMDPLSTSSGCAPAHPFPLSRIFPKEPG